MPAVSLVVCVYQERDLLRRLLENAAGCFDDLVVIHDGPDVAGVQSSVEAAAGRFFVRPLQRHQEPHWPFAWKQAAHDWILRLDADEFPSREMKEWLQRFRAAPEPADNISGYTCHWPLWSGKRMVTRSWPSGRSFLFHRQRVRFFGMPEQIPIPDQRYQPLDLILHHEPIRKSYGFNNLIVRQQAYRWRNLIALALQGNPTDLACWRWDSQTWPPHWAALREHPWRTALKGLLIGPLRSLREQWRAEHWFYPAAALSGPVHLAMMAGEYRRVRRARKKKN
jgi:hypothetical protein